MRANGHDLAGLVKRAAYRRLTTRGAAGLELGYLAEDLGISVARVHACFPSRGDLLTAMMLDAYNDMGAAAEAADRRSVRAGAGPLERWSAAWRSVLDWSLAYPHEFALMWGPPLPDYSAPPETMVAGSRAAVILIGIIREGVDRNQVLNCADIGTLSDGMRENVAILSGGVLVGIPDPLIARILLAWSQLIGAVSSVVYGYAQEFARDADSFFEYVSAETGRYVGLPH